MAAIGTPDVVPERTRRIDVAANTEVALPQLDGDERRAVADLLTDLGRGKASLHNLIAQRLRGGEPLLFLPRVPGADAMRLFARVEPDAIIVVEEARAYTPDGNLSAYVSEGLRRQILSDRLRDRIPARVDYLHHVLPGHIDILRVYRRCHSLMIYEILQINLVRILHVLRL